MNDQIRQEQDACNYLRNDCGLSRREIAEELGIPERRVKQRLYEYYMREKDNEDAYDYKSIKKPNVIIDEDMSWLQIDTAKLAMENDTKVFKQDSTLFGHLKADKQREDVAELIQSKHNKRSVKILNLSDLHVPFTDWENVYKVVRNHRDSDILMINGDLLDLFAVSKFAKDKIVAVKKEMDEAREFLEEMSGIFKDIVLTDGNHERRLGSMIKNQIPVEAQFLFPSDILKVLVDGTVLGKNKINNVHVVGSYWVRLWDVIFAHPDNYSGTQLKTVIDVSQYFLLNKGVQHKMCVIGHTHQAGWVVSGDIKKMETGCLCHDMDYHHGSKMTRNNWTKAHAVIHINEGTVDFNESQLFIL